MRIGGAEWELILVYADARYTYKSQLDSGEHPTKYLTPLTMPPGPEILTLENFAEQHLDALLTATSKSAFDAALDALLAPTAQIVLNGASVSRAAYGAYLWKAQAHESSATVAFKGVVAVPRDSKAIVQVRTAAGLSGGR